MADITEHYMYIEGVRGAQAMIKHIEKTTYETLEGAVISKTELIRNFEEQFGFTRDMENPLSDYAMNLGMLDTLEEAYEKEKENNSDAE